MSESDEKRMMQIHYDNGTIEEVEVILPFEFPDTKNKYVVFTKEEKCEDGNILVYITKIHINEDGITELLSVDDEEEWNRVKKYIRGIVTKDEDERQKVGDPYVSDVEISESIPLSVMWELNKKRS